MARAKDNPQLKGRTMKDGRVSLYLQYYVSREETPVKDEDGEPVRYTTGAMKGKPKYKVTNIRRQEALNLCYRPRPRTPFEKWEKAEILKLAEQIRWDRAQEFQQDKRGYRLWRDKQGVDFIAYFQRYIDAYTKKDINVLKSALQRFKDFLTETPEYTRYVGWIKPSAIDKEMVEAYTEYLQSKSKGEGAHAIFARFKKVVKHAVEHGVIADNPCKEVTISASRQLKKDILSPEEIGRLVATHCGNQEVKRAFLFSLCTGVRLCDAKAMTYNNVDYSNRLLRFEQVKVEGHSSSSVVTIPLTDDILNLIGTPEAGKDANTQIFALPTPTACNKTLQRWVTRAGITKHITWHCARHSFAVNLLNNGANMKTTADLLGHSSTAITEVYVRAVDGLKRAAIESLPHINLQDDGE